MRTRALPRAALFLCALLVGGLAHAATQPLAQTSVVGAKPEQQSAGYAAANSASEPRGTERAPIFVKSVPSPETEDDAAHKHYERHEKPSLDRGLTYGTYALATFTFLLFCFTAALWYVTYRLSVDAKETSSTQHNKMQDSIEEAGRSTAAMEKIAKATIENAALMQGVMHRQMRAYVSAEVEGAIYQDERLKFQVDIRLTNSGFTPARNVSYAIAADVLGDTLPADFSFPNSGAINTNDATLSPRGTFIIHGFLKNRLSDADAEAVMTNEGKRLHCWGTIYYEDIFGDKWETNFCVSINFNRFTDAEGKLGVRQTQSYHPKHNNAT